MSLAAQGRHEEAVKFCLRAAESDDSPNPALVLATVLIRASEYQPPAEVEKLLAAVLALYRKIVELRPNDLAALNNLATLLGDEKGRTTEALQFIDRAIKRAGSRPAYLCQRTVLNQGANRRAQLAGGRLPAVRWRQLAYQGLLPSVPT